MASSSKTKRIPPRKAHSISSSHARSSSATTTKIVINVYDLLPPGRLSSFLWMVGGSLLHSGVVIGGREYAYGGHNKRNTSGVYYTQPQYEPPGAIHRTSILQGHTCRTPDEIQHTIQIVSDQYLGPNYNLLTHNCNHFTSALVTALTGKPAPAWLNRAAAIGLAFPCIVPREWIVTPNMETADGEQLEGGHGGDATERAGDKDEDEDEEDSEACERASMLESERLRCLREDQRRAREEQVRMRREQGKGSKGTNRANVAGAHKRMGGSAFGISAEEEVMGRSLVGGKRIATVDEPPPRLVKRTDIAGRELHVAERAPVPKSAAVCKS